MDVSNEEDSSGLVCGREVEGDGLDVFAEIWLRKEVRQEGPGGDAGEEDVEEENREDGEGGHGADRRVGWLKACASHGRYKYGGSLRLPHPFQLRQGLITGKSE